MQQKVNSSSIFVVRCVLCFEVFFRSFVRLHANPEQEGGGEGGETMGKACHFRIMSEGSREAEG